LAAILAPIDTDICYLITGVVVRVSFLATLTPEGIVISANLAINTIAINISTAVRVIELLATLTIDTTILA
jgi:hypothetical protein